MSKITVGNLRDRIGDEGIRCDRLSPLGNPFPMNSKGDEKQRLIVIEAYRRYLYLVAVLGHEPNEAVKTVRRWYQSRDVYIMATNNILPTKADILAELNRIQQLSKSQDITLYCWCSPLACHCDRIVDYIHWRILNPC